MPVSEVHQLLGGRFFGILAVEESAARPSSWESSVTFTDSLALFARPANSGSLSCPRVWASAGLASTSPDKTERREAQGNTRVHERFSSSSCASGGVLCTAS